MKFKITISPISSNKSEIKQKKLLNKRVKVKVKGQRINRQSNVTDIVEEKKNQEALAEANKSGYRVESLDMKIDIYQPQCEGVIRSTIKYHFQKGQFTSVMIKLSLDGTVDDGVGISVDSLTP